MLSVFVASTNTTPTTIATNVLEQAAGLQVQAVDSADPVEREFRKVLAEDDAAQEEVDKWIRDNQAFVEQGGGLPREEMNRRIEERFATVRKSYELFLGQHADHARGYIAYGSFLNDIGEEEAAVRQWEKALKLDPKNPAIWNNLANYYGHRSPVKKAFEYYAKAIELNPYESVYYHNFGTTVYLFRKDAKEYFNITEQEVFDKALGLYDKAQKLDPQNFPLATDIAQTYYGIRPMRTEAALQAWTNALNTARDEIEREGIYLHFARIKLNAGLFTDAQMHLDAVTNGIYGDLKRRLLRNLEAKQKSLSDTNKAAGLETTNVLEEQSSPGLVR